MPGVMNWRAPAYRLYERARGRRTFRYFDFLIQSQWRSAEQVREFQWRELHRLLAHSYARVPFHRRRMQAIGMHPEDLRGPEDFACLPLMEKADFRRPEAELLAAGAETAPLFTNGTGGSTGAPMRYRHDRLSYEWRQAAHLRGNGWAGAEPGRGEFHLWGEPMRRGPWPAELKRRLWQFVLNHHHADSYRLSPELMDAYLARYERSRPHVMIGYARSLELFAAHAVSRGGPRWKPRGIIATAEKLLPHQRSAIEHAFGAPVYDRYGCREVMLIAMECEHRRGLHLTAENLFVEILRPDGREARPGETGEVVVTDLHNYAMPFLRYRNGDLAVASGRACPCGRGLPLIEEVGGRTLDVLRTPEGRRISGVFVPMFFKEYPWVREFQLEQEALDLIHVRLRPEAGVAPERLAGLKEDLAGRLGPNVRLRFQLVDEIPPSPSGKHRPVLSRLGAEAPAAPLP